MYNTGQCIIKKQKNFHKRTKSKITWGIFNVGDVGRSVSSVQWGLMKMKDLYTRVIVSSYISLVQLLSVHCACRLLHYFQV